MKNPQSKATKMWKDKQEKELYSVNDELYVETKNETFRPMLAKLFDKDKNTDYPYMCQPKLDGVRCVAYKKDVKVILENLQRN